MERKNIPGTKMKHNTAITIFLILTFVLSPLIAWNNHAGITYIILNDHWKNNAPKKVKVESLESYLLKEKATLSEVLAEIDSFVAEKLPHCPKPSPDLIFTPESVNASNVINSFYRAIRVNPNHKASLYTQVVNVKATSPSSLLPTITTLNDKGKLVNETFRPLSSGSLVSPIDILVTAVDEPDYDLDLYLFSDSGSEVGKLYQFGEQSFGNPIYEYSSQAPFHMGFYHESGIVYTLAGFIKRTFPEYRIYQFTKLSEHAFRTGHPYWGYRFAGWALHYLQDLTQPYHSSVLPRVGTGNRIWVQVLATIGLPSQKNKRIDDVSARHTLIEEYQYYLIKEILHGRQTDHTVYKAIQSMDPAVDSIPVTFESIRNTISRESYETADATDLGLEHLGIDKFEKLYEESHPIHKILAELLQRTSKHTRSFVDGLPK